MSETAHDDFERFTALQLELFRLFAKHPILRRAPTELRTAVQDLDRALEGAAWIAAAVEGNDGGGQFDDATILSAGAALSEVIAAWQRYLAAIARWYADWAKAQSGGRG